MPLARETVGIEVGREGFAMEDEIMVHGKAMLNQWNEVSYQTFDMERDMDVGSANRMK